MGIYLFLLMLLIGQSILTFSLRRKRVVFKAGYIEITFVELLVTIDVILLAFFFTFRGNMVGTDTKTYNYWFSKLNEVPLLKIIEWTKVSKIEVGCGIIAKIGKFIFGEKYGAWLLISCVMFITIAKFITVFSKDVLLSLFLFITFSMYNQSCNISGQFLAAGILLLSVTYLTKNNYRGYIITLLIAIIVHRSAVIGVLFFFMYKMKKFSAKISVGIVAISFALSLSATSIIQYVVSKTIYSSYLYWEVSSENGVSLIMNLLIFFCLLIFRKEIKLIDKYADMWILTAAITVSLNFFISSLGMIARMMVYFKLFYIVSIPSLINALHIKKSLVRVSKFISVGIILLFTIYYYYSITFSTCFDTVPYYFVWK